MVKIGLEGLPPGLSQPSKPEQMEVESAVLDEAAVRFIALPCAPGESTIVGCLNQIFSNLPRRENSNSRRTHAVPAARSTRLQVHFYAQCRLAKTCAGVFAVSQDMSRLGVSMTSSCRVYFLLPSVSRLQACNRDNVSTGRGIWAHPVHRAHVLGETPI
jgi:hypothetical protein